MIDLSKMWAEVYFVLSSQFTSLTDGRRTEGHLVHGYTAVAYLQRGKNRLTAGFV